MTARTDLTPWARQGVLLLNTGLTVEQGAAFAHAGHGWETFTRAALEYALACANTPVAAVLWGKPAQQYAPIFTAAAAHRPVLVLESAHPSPLSAYRGFFGSDQFGKINDFLQDNGQPEIRWQVSVPGILRVRLYKKRSPRVAVHKTGFTKQIIWQLPDKGC